MATIMLHRCCATSTGGKCTGHHALCLLQLSISRPAAALDNTAQHSSAALGPLSVCNRYSVGVCTSFSHRTVWAVDQLLCAPILFAEHTLQQVT
jgi:hypothetical protein